MMVSDLMSRNVHYCDPDARASYAARAMWNYDIGCVPVVDAVMRPVGMITDRDLCMAMLHEGKPLHLVRVGDVMSRATYTCHPSDTLAQAEQTMQTHQVRRLLVIGDDGKLVGVLSLNDIALAARTPFSRLRARLRGDVDETLAEVSRHRRIPVGVQF